MEIRERFETGAAKLEARVQPEIDAVKERLSAVNTQVVSFIKAHPTQCLLGALALGFVVGRIARAVGSRHASK